MISVRQSNGITVVRPETHRLDELLGRQLIAAMRPYMVAGALVVLDLSDVCYLNSEAIGYLTTCARRLSHHRGGLAVCGLQEGPQGVFRVLRMERILRGVFASEQKAVEALSQQVAH
jgi:anti-anti-sigma factor